MTDQSVEIMLSSQRSPADALVDAFAKSKKSIDAVVYKFSDPEIFAALVAAVEGQDEVALRLLVDRRLIDGKRKKWGLAQKLAGLNGDVQVRKWSGHKLHAKFVIIDDRHVFSGSFNWTKGGRENTELLLDFDDPQSVLNFTYLFEDLWKDSKKL
jgi:phosphatidylserine/phosphatidylglycerophosphate/cardiolipin synthase-like enzyme